VSVEKRGEREMSLENTARRQRSAVTALPNRLAAQIMETARREKMATGTHLREQALADAFGVSRTPVRAALQLLAEMDIIESRKNRGFFLKSGSEPLGPIQSSLVSDPVDPIYYKIAEERLAGQIKIRFTEMEFMRRYGVSRVRLSKLLSQMAKEGWVERTLGHGWEFQPILTSTAAYEQSYRFRMLVEPAALVEPGYTVQTSAFDRVRLEQQWIISDRGGYQSPIDTFQFRANFHETIVGCSGNAFFLESIRRVNRLRRLFEYRLKKTKRELVQESREHIAILDLLERGLNAEASQFLRSHLETARTTKIKLASAAELNQA
jgi:DNA-binding GntR family transcriptional regulator